MPLPAHGPEYLIEAALLGTFMVVACTATALLHHTASPIARALRPALARRALTGVLMGLTAIALITSPWGQRSGAHMNPGVTLTFLMLGKVAPLDALGYILAQFAGGLAGVLLSALALRQIIRHPSVNYAATLPGRAGPRAAWLGEFTIALLMMSMVLASSNYAPTAPYTPLFAGLMVATFITVEAPLSGMSMNPARTFASALPARALRSLWIYFTAPPLGMLAAALVYTALARPVYCAKLDHRGDSPCPFDCHIREMQHPKP